MAWWSDWYSNATGAVSASITAVETSVGSLFKDPPTGSGAYIPDDPSLSDAVRARQTGTPYDLFPVEAGENPLGVQTDIQQAILTRPKTWDEMSWWEKAKTYAGIAPGAIADTIGISDRVGASTPVSGPSGGVQTIANTVDKASQAAASAVGRTASSALGLGPAGLGGFLSSTLVKVIIGLVVVVVGLYFVLKIQARVAA